MSEQEKQQQRIYDLLNAKTKAKKNYQNNHAQIITPFITLHGAF